MRPFSLSISRALHPWLLMPLAPGVEEAQTMQNRSLWWGHIDPTVGRGTRYKLFAKVTSLETKTRIKLFPFLGVDITRVKQQQKHWTAMFLSDKQQNNSQQKNKATGDAVSFRVPVYSPKLNIKTQRIFAVLEYYPTKKTQQDRSKIWPASQGTVRLERIPTKKEKRKEKRKRRKEKNPPNKGRIVDNVAV